MQCYNLQSAICSHNKPRPHLDKMRSLVGVLITQWLLFGVQGESISRSYKVLHSFSPSESFTPRSTISLSHSSETNGIVTSIEHENECLSTTVMEKMDALVADGGFYQVQVIDSESDHTILTSVEACQVRRANFRESISLTIGDTGSLISASFSPIVSPLAQDCTVLPPLTESNKELSFQSTVAYSTTTEGMTVPSILPHVGPPVGLKWIPQPKMNKASSTSKDGSAGPNIGGEEDSQPEQQSFLRRYWYIILPVVIMTFFNPEESAENQASSSGPAGGTVAAATAGARGSASSRSRRGKRG